MHGRQRSRVLGSGFILLVAGTLALAACNSGSVSGSSQKPSGSTTAAQGSGATSGKTTLADALANKLNSPR